jgi:hypothetical protein
MEKVIYCVLSCLTSLTTIPHEVLFQSAQGQAVAISNSTLLNLYTVNPDIPLIYFSRETYQSSVRGLNPTEIQAVLDKRAAQWAPQILNQVSHWIYQQELKVLALTTQQIARLSTTERERPLIYFKQTLSLLAHLTGEGRYDDLSFTELLELALEQESLLKAELQSQPNQPLLSKEIQNHQLTCEYLAQQLATRGKPEYQKAPLYSELWRGLYITPIDDQLLTQLKLEYQPYTLWMQGLVTRWRLRKIPELQQLGRRSQVLYPNPGAFIEDLNELTAPQLNVSFTQRAQADAQRQQTNDYLNQLRLNAVLLWQSLAERATNENPSLHTSILAIIETQTLHLINGLHQDRSWLGDNSNLAAFKAELLGAERAIIDDLTFFTTLAQQRKLLDVASSLAKLENLKRSQIVNLEQ